MVRDLQINNSSLNLLILGFVEKDDLYYFGHLFLIRKIYSISENTYCLRYLHPGRDDSALQYF